MLLSKKDYARKKIHNVCLVWIDNSVTRDNCSASLDKSGDAEWLSSWRNFQFRPNNHFGFFFLHSLTTMKYSIFSHLSMWPMETDMVVLMIQSFSLEMSHLMTKPKKWHVRPAKTQTSQGICPVWSESSLCAQWIAKDWSFLHADSEDSDQTGWMPRLIWVFAGRTCHFVGFVMRWLKCLCGWASSASNFGTVWFGSTLVCDLLDALHNGKATLFKF